MKIGRHKSFLYSLLLHLLLLFALVYFSQKSAPLEATKKPRKAIKSYIYQPPKAKPVEQKTAPETIVAVKEPEPIKKVVPLEKVEKKVVAQATNEKVTTPKNVIKKQPVEIETKQATKATFSPYAQLNKLKAKIAYDIARQDIPSYRKATSGSPLHGESAIAPESTITETIDAKRARTTQRYSDRLSITKNDNGTCTIVEDLSAVGIEGVKAVSGFNCGESKDKKAFREHMEGVLKKLGKAN